MAEIMANLRSFFDLIAEEEKKKKIDLEAKLEKAKAEQEVIESLAKVLSQMAENRPEIESTTEQVTEQVVAEQEQITEQVKEVIKESNLGLLGGTTATKTADPLTPFDQKFVTFDDLNKHYKTYIARVQQQLSTLGGGGEVNLRYLDDVARETITDGLFLKYNGTSRKFEFANVNANALITNTTYVTTSEYTVQDDDYYLGVDYAGPTTIILPASDTNGRCIVIKDEDGDAETNPITVQGTVDNDAGGFILQINNGSIQLIYRNGWRII
jgi:hypothetical protein